MSAALRQCLMERNWAGARSVAREINPAWSPPDDPRLLEVWGHMTRTDMQTITPRERYYSHCWLIDHGQHSLLPQRLRTKAEQMYPKIVKTIGIATSGKAGPEACGLIERRMSNAAMESIADNDSAEKTVIHIQQERFQERKGLMLPTPKEWIVPIEWRQ